MLGLPIIASAHGYEIDYLILLIHILMFALLAGWGVYFVIALVRFRKKKNPRADYKGFQGHVSSVIEIAVVVIEAVLLIGFSIPFWAKQVNAFPDRTDTIDVRVVAEQFAWNVHYPGKDGIFGRSNPKLVDGQSNPIGLDLSDPHAADDITLVNQMHLPIGRPAVIHISSKDVIHSFAINAMRVKQDAIPGMSVKTWFTPTRINSNTISLKDLAGIVRSPESLFRHLVEKGYIDDRGQILDKFKTVQNASQLELDPQFVQARESAYSLMRLAIAYDISCAQLCGIGHYRMKGFLTIDSPEDFEKWLSEQSTSGSSSGGSGTDSFW